MEEWRGEGQPVGDSSLQSVLSKAVGKVLGQIVAQFLFCYVNRKLENFRRQGIKNQAEENLFLSMIFML